MTGINIVTLPRTCFAAAPLDYPCNEDTLKIEKFALAEDNYSLNVFAIDKQNVEEIVSNKDESIYVNLDVRKYLLVEAQLKSGKVQGLSCNYHIYTNQDEETICVMTVGDLINGLHIDDYINDHHNYTRAKELLENAIDFDLIELTDYVRMTYTNPNRSTWKNSNANWNAFANHHRVNIQTIKGMSYPSDKKIIKLNEVLRYSNNRSITTEEASKIRRLLGNKDTEKVALTIMNSINPEKSFVELICLINHMDPMIARNNPAVPILPLVRGAYGTDTRIVRTSDRIVKEYVNAFKKHPDVDVLERIADSYYHPKLEKSSVFDFKLKIKTK